MMVVKLEYFLFVKEPIETLRKYNFVQLFAFS